MDRGAPEGKRTWYSESRKGERWSYIPERWHWRGVAFPACVPRVSTSSRPPSLQLWRCWLTVEGYCCHRCGCILPVPAALSVQINACSVTLLCCNAMDSSFLSPIHSLPLSAPSACPSSPRSLALAHTQTHTLTHEKPEYKWGAFLKDMIVLLDVFLSFFSVKVREWVEKMQSPNPWLASFEGLSCLLVLVQKPLNSLRLSGKNIKFVGLLSIWVRALVPLSLR